MTLLWRVRLAYALGHVLNDLCASVWFTYTLVFFKFGIVIPTKLAGTIILLGQVVDAFVTPLVGIYSDKLMAKIDPQSENTHPNLNQNLRTNNLVNNYGTIHVPPNHIDDCGIENQMEIDQIENDAMRLSTVQLVAPKTRFKSWYPSGRKIWHLGGSVLVIVSFPLLFGLPPNFVKNYVWAKMLYYGSLVTVFQAGWAAVQITHLALMNDLTQDSSERTLLTSLRYLFTIISNLAVYTSTYVLFHYTHKPKNQTLTNHFSDSDYYPTIRTLESPYGRFVFVAHPLHPHCDRVLDDDPDVNFGSDDLFPFQILSLSIVGVGCIITFLFHLGMRNTNIQMNESNSMTEKYCGNDNETAPINPLRVCSSSTNININSFKDWFKIHLFWILALSYIFVRLIVNVSQTYISIYLLQSLLLEKYLMSLVPLTIYVASIFAVLIQKPFQKVISREVNIIIGLVFVTIFCILVNYPGTPPLLHRIYISAGILGIGCTIIMITSLAMVSDLIGNNQKHGAFVYGSMSFGDKFANGIVIQLIELFWTKNSGSHYYQRVESYGIGCFVLVLSVLVIIHFWFRKLPSVTSINTP